jgi:hypothetical protein
MSVRSLGMVILTTLILCSSYSVEASKSDKSTKSHKSSKHNSAGLKQEVEELQAIVAALQADVAELQANDDPDASYVGNYHTTLFETGIFGCGNTINPGPLFGTPAAISYFQEQAVSSTVTRSATTVAVADGTSLHIPEHVLSIQELRLSGQYEEDSRIEGNFTLSILSDGELNFDAGPDASITGQMSENGDAFTILARGLFDENGCDDAFTVLMIGHRIQ